MVAFNLWTPETKIGIGLDHMQPGPKAGTGESKGGEGTEGGRPGQNMAGKEARRGQGRVATAGRVFGVLVYWASQRGAQPGPPAHTEVPSDR